MNFCDGNVVAPQKYNRPFPRALTDNPVRTVPLLPRMWNRSIFLFQKTVQKRVIMDCYEVRQSAAEFSQNAYEHNREAENETKTSSSFWILLKELMSHWLKTCPSCHFLAALVRLHVFQATLPKQIVSVDELLGAKMIVP